MALGSGWILYGSSSFEIIVILILFLIICVTLHTLCINCFSSQSPSSPEDPDVKQTQSAPPNERPDQLSTDATLGNEHAQNSVQQVPVWLHHNRSHTTIYNQSPKVYIHNRAESHGYFSKEMMAPNLANSADYTDSCANSVFPRFSDLPPFPSIFQQPNVQAKPVKSSPSSQYNETVHDTSGRDQINNSFTDHTYSALELEVSEEHPYESIGMVKVSEPTTEDQSENESPSRDGRASVKPAVSHPSTSLTAKDCGQAEGSGLPSSLLPVTEDGKPTMGTAVYAAVDWKSKSLKWQEFPVPAFMEELNANDSTEDSAPPLPQKKFEEEL